MFESEDFDLDEDFLKDVCDKESQYYTQQLQNNQPDNPAKKPKLVKEPLQPSCSKTIEVSDEQENSNDEKPSQSFAESLLDSEEEFDDDFLKDLGDKESQYFLQRSGNDRSENPAKTSRLVKEPSQIPCRETFKVGNEQENLKDRETTESFVETLFDSGKDFDDDFFKDLCNKESQYCSRKSGNYRPDESATEPRLLKESSQGSCSKNIEIADEQKNLNIAKPSQGFTDVFGNSEIDFDDDFLKDIGNKESQYYSQQSGNLNKKNTLVKEPMNDGQSPQTFTDISSNYVNDASLHSEDNCTRTNLILETFKNYSAKKTGKSSSSNSQSSDLGRSSHIPAGKFKNRENDLVKDAALDSQVNLSRTNLILGLFKNKSVVNSEKNIDHQKSAQAFRDTLLKSEKENSSAEDLFSDNDHNPKRLIAKSGSIQKACKKPNESNQRIVNHIRKQVNASMGKNQKKLDWAASNKTMFRPRKFPGPAGCMPEVIDGIIPLIPDEHCLDESIKSVNDTNKTNISEYCSQDTSNLFANGAWQSMLNDLGPNVLDGHNIATIKHNAKLNKYKNGRVPLLAGVVQSSGAEWESEMNLSIVLKDLTDTIEGVIHRDVQLRNSNEIEPGVVLLLSNVGILTTIDERFSKKSRLIISRENIVNIYMEKDRVVIKSQMSNNFQGLVSGGSRINEIRNKLLEHNTAQIRPGIGQSTLSIENRFNVRHGLKSGSTNPRTSSTNTNSNDKNGQSLMQDSFTQNNILENLLSNLSPTPCAGLESANNCTGTNTSQVSVAERQKDSDRIQYIEQPIVKVDNTKSLFESDDFDFEEDFALSLDVNQTSNS